MAERILFVDDESAVLDGYKRALYKDFAVTTAVGGVEGLKTIEAAGPFSVIVSDMRMPGMSGAQFLAKARQMAPDTVRILLTGQTEMNAAIEAINEGSIFRFLTKPCEKTTLINALLSGVEQYLLVTAERELLEKTFLGSVKVLADVLGAASPEIFGRSMRILRYVQHIARRLNLPKSWRLEAAATLSQLGCVTIPVEILNQAYAGMVMSPEDQTRYNSHPQATCELISHIPRLEVIGWMIKQQLGRQIEDAPPGVNPALAEEVKREATILKLAVTFDDYRVNAKTNAEAIAPILSRTGEFNKLMLDTLVDISAHNTAMEVQHLLIAELAAGMVLDQDIRDRSGALKVIKGQEITGALRLKLLNLAQSDVIENRVMALVRV